MKELLKRYYDARLRLYTAKGQDRPEIAARYALDDMLATVKRYTRDTSQKYAMEVLKMEVADLEAIK